MGNIEAVKAKVQQYLFAVADTVGIDKDGDFTIRNGSSRAFIWVNSKGEDDPTHVFIQVPLLYGVNESPALHEYIAYHADDYIFGHLSLRKRDDGIVCVDLTHRLLGDYLDEAELAWAVGGMLSSADELDDEMQSRFGGQRFHEE
ncbi:MAG: YbjN domain-containing protein [Propionibacteriaceae bacterium]|jgi:hypothetical protein|nr:YbjN domain-containing protein [Propionibacteriaceae bacterium]